MELTCGCCSFKVFSKKANGTTTETPGNSRQTNEAANRTNVASPKIHYVSREDWAKLNRLPPSRNPSHHVVIFSTSNVTCSVRNSHTHTHTHTIPTHNPTPRSLACSYFLPRLLVYSYFPPPLLLSKECRRAQ